VFSLSLNLVINHGNTQRPEMRQDHEFMRSAMEISLESKLESKRASPV